MYIAIVKTENNRIAKFQDYDASQEADDHVSKYGGLVYNNSAKTPYRDLWIDGQVVKVVPVIDPPPPTKEEIYNDIIKNQKVLKALALVCAEKFNMTPAQLKSAIKAKM